MSEPALMGSGDNQTPPAPTWRLCFNPRGCVLRMWHAGSECLPPDAVPHPCRLAVARLFRHFQPQRQAIGLLMHSGLFMPMRQVLGGVSRWL